jgi:hypothetical protein
MTREEFIKQDKGGEPFTLFLALLLIQIKIGDLKKTKNILEIPVKPIDKVKIPSLFDTRFEIDTEVYFIDPEMIPVIAAAQDRNPRELNEMFKKIGREKY